MTQQSEMDAFFSDNHRESERVNGRYKFVDPFGNQVTATSASNYGFPLADQFALNRWKMRKLIEGLRQRPDLLAMIGTADIENDLGKVDELIQTALQVAGTTVDANMGTAIHDALRLADLGQPYPEWAEPYVVAYSRELVRLGLTVGLVEADVYSPGLGARGRLDRTYIEADGTHVLGDIKTTGRLELQKHEISVQLAVYQSATHLRQSDGSWLAIPRGKHPLRDDYAIVVHVDRAHATVTLYRVDLWIGKRGAVLAEQVRAWRKTGPVLLPYVPPSEPVTTEVTGATRDPFEKWSSTEEEHRVREGLPPAQPHVPDTSPVEPTMPWSSAVSDAPPAPEPETTFDTGNPMPTAPPSAPVITATEFMKLTKAKAQQYAKAHGLQKLNRTKTNLMADLKKMGHQFAPDGAPTGGAPMATVTVHPAHTEQFRQEKLAALAAANSPGEMELIRKEIVRIGGDQAWTDEMTEVARTRVAELDAMPKAAEPSSESAIAARINACTGTEDLAKLWEEITVGGTVMGNWTPFIEQTAKDHMTRLTTQRPAAAANPFTGG